MNRNYERKSINASRSSFPVDPSWMMPFERSGLGRDFLRNEDLILFLQHVNQTGSRGIRRFNVENGNAASRSGLFVIMGGPGSGKTSLLKKMRAVNISTGEPVADSYPDSRAVLIDALRSAIIIAMVSELTGDIAFLKGEDHSLEAEHNKSNVIDMSKQLLLIDREDNDDLGMRARLLNMCDSCADVAKGIADETIRDRFVAALEDLVNTINELEEIWVGLSGYVIPHLKVITRLLMDSLSGGIVGRDEIPNCNGLGRKITLLIGDLVGKSLSRDIITAFKMQNNDDVGFSLKEVNQSVQYAWSSITAQKSDIALDLLRASSRGLHTSVFTVDSLRDIFIGGSDGFGKGGVNLSAVRVLTLMSAVAQKFGLSILATYNPNVADDALYSSVASLIDSSCSGIIHASYVLSSSGSIRPHESIAVRTVPGSEVGRSMVSLHDLLAVFHYDDIDIERDTSDQNGKSDQATITERVKRALRESDSVSLIKGTF